jgi:hypothetical protein
MTLAEKRMHYHGLMAQYWIAMATTGIAKKRKMFHGIAGKELTDGEKTEDALETAMRHIHIVGEIIDKEGSDATSSD